MTIRPFELTTPTGQVCPSWGVYDGDRLLAPCGSREIAMRWRRLHEDIQSVCNKDEHDSDG